MEEDSDEEEEQEEDEEENDWDWSFLEQVTVGTGTALTGLLGIFVVALMIWRRRAKAKASRVTRSCLET